MTQPIDRGGLRELKRILLGAGNEQIKRVVAMVDALPERGIADELIAPLRPRLAQLRLRRPPNFTRLLFTPLDPVIVPPTQWRRGLALVPRPALAPLAEIVRNGLAGLAAEIDATIAAAAKEPDPVGRFGPTLWPEAAWALQQAARPSCWKERSGVPDEAFQPIVAGVAAVLAQADTMLGLEQRGLAEADGKQLAEMLQAVAPQGTGALSLLIAVLLARLSRPDLVIAAAADVTADGPGRQAYDLALDQTLESLEGSVAAGPLAQADLGPAALEAARLAMMLSALDAGQLRPAQRRQLGQIRRQAAEACQSRYQAGLEAGLLQKMRTRTAPAGDEEMTALEGHARDLRALELAGRLLGGEGFDPVMRGAAGRLAGAGRQATGLTSVDRARVTEILLGSEQAQGVLDGG
ncbi:MAG TPA: hypothetical protein VME92_13720 [Acetobacteraceae bacterium]|nr:hypothetical protein [Acetobacteraceae bacterium]